VAMVLKMGGIVPFWGNFEGQGKEQNKGRIREKTTQRE